MEASPLKGLALRGNAENIGKNRQYLLKEAGLVKRDYCYWE